MASKTLTIRALRTVLASFAFLATLLFGACAGSPPAITHHAPLPENIQVDPPGSMQIITRLGPTQLTTALRALGIPFDRQILHEDSAFTLPEAPVAILDEGALDDETIAHFYPRLLRWARDGGTLIVLMQSPESMSRLPNYIGQDIMPRSVTYTIDLFPAREKEQSLIWPNRIDRADLDSFRVGTRQLSHGNGAARAIIAGNTIRPDSSAALLTEPFGKGTMWYVGLPITARAAAGLPAEQKLLANIVSAVRRRDL